MFAPEILSDFSYSRSSTIDHASTGTVPCVNVNQAPKKRRGGEDKTTMYDLDLPPAPGKVSQKSLLYNFITFHG